MRRDEGVRTPGAAGDEPDPGFDAWLLRRLREGLAHREIVLWDDDGYRKPRLTVVFPEDATGEDPVDRLEQALLATPDDAAALGYVSPAVRTRATDREPPAFLRLAGGWAWHALDTPEACASTAGIARDRIRELFLRDLGPDGTPKDGRAYFGLSRDGDPDGMVVAVAVGGRGPWGADDGPFALGIEGSDPYPEHSARIDALSREIGFPLPRQCHPSYEAMPSVRETLHPARLAPHVMAEARSAASGISVPLEDLLGVLVAEALDARALRRRG